MATYSLLFVRNDLKTPLTLYNVRHEQIHAVQHYELLVLALLVLVPIQLCGGMSWWWLLMAPVAPFILYLLCWLVELLLPPYGAAYRNVCFETEAIYNEADPDYLHKRRPFAWLRYISNRRYPYLSAQERSALYERETR